MAMAQNHFVDSRIFSISTFVDGHLRLLYGIAQKSTCINKQILGWSNGQIRNQLSPAICWFVPHFCDSEIGCFAVSGYDRVRECLKRERVQKNRFKSINIYLCSFDWHLRGKYAFNLSVDPRPMMLMSCEQKNTRPTSCCEACAKGVVLGLAVGFGILPVSSTFPLINPWWCSFTWFQIGFQNKTTKPTRMRIEGTIYVAIWFRIEGCTVANLNFFCCFPIKNEYCMYLQISTITITGLEWWPHRAPPRNFRSSSVFACFMVSCQDWHCRTRTFSNLISVPDGFFKCVLQVSSLGKNWGFMFTCRNVGQQKLGLSPHQWGWQRKT